MNSHTNFISTMKAVIYSRKKLPGGLIYGDVEKPVPNDDEVLLKVVASSVNAADYRSMKMDLIPKIKIFGADHVIDYTKENFSKKSKSYDLILAINGNYPFSACKRLSIIVHY